ncbi:MAG: 1,4-beta-xylanase [Acidobacteriaceae bacterium]|nr:1,4-beta-xylanase [Acidobacteriaceae bacterium]
MFFTAALLIAAASPGAQQPQARGQWSKEKAAQWYAREPWPVGSNYLPAYAENELDMWQAATFDTKEIDRELGWAQEIGMNTMRVFLHDLLWKQDSEGFKERIDTFLSICDRHKIKPVFVLFDSVWDPFPHLGPQPPPRPGVHNSRWLQSPGAEALSDKSQYPRLEAYVKGVVGAFGQDRRVLAWDVWNEPDNLNGSSYGKSEPPNKVQLVLALLPQAFAWARSVDPQQPLTSGIWHEDPAAPQKLSAMAKEQLSLSDITSFHNYDPPAKFEAEVKWLETYGRPIICTEYMARPLGSTFQNILPIAKQFKTGAINWGFVAGKSQTYLPWDSWQKPYVDRQPAVWFHDIFHSDGKPYRPAEVEFIRQITAH